MKRLDIKEDQSCAAEKCNKTGKHKVRMIFKPLDEYRNNHLSMDSQQKEKTGPSLRQTKAFLKENQFSSN